MVPQYNYGAMVPQLPCCHTATLAIAPWCHCACHGAMVPHCQPPSCHGATQPWCQQLWCHSAMVPRCHIVPWCHDAMLPPCHDVMVPSCHGAISWCHLASTVPWCHTRSPDVKLIVWCNGAMVPWCYGAMMVPWCQFGIA